MWKVVSFKDGVKLFGESLMTKKEFKKFAGRPWRKAYDSDGDVVCLDLDGTAHQCYRENGVAKYGI
jgi:hypothetical protein